MPAHSDLTSLALVALAALACGIAMARLKQPAVVGYILAGVILGPSAIGFVENRDQVATLAELGVLMLLFFIAMELSLRGFKAVWKIALLATALQIGGAVGVMLALSQLFGWSLELAVLLGFVVALSSTAVVIKMLEQINILRSPPGHLIVGILIAQDLAVVPMMLTINAMAQSSIGPLDIAKIAASMAILALLIVYLSRRKRVTLPLPPQVARQYDLMPLAGLAFCFGAAALSGLVGLSPVYGAFLAGLVIGNSTARAAMIRSTRPVQSVLMMVFFLSIGLLVDLAFVWDNLFTVLLLVLVVTVLKTAFNIAILHLLREPWPHAFIAGVMLAQVGEFSFVLGQSGVQSGLIGAEESRLIIAVTVCSLLFSPLWLASARRLLRMVLSSVTSFGEIFDLVWGEKAMEALRGSAAAASGARRAVGVVGRGLAILTRRLRRSGKPPVPANEPGEPLSIGAADRPPPRATDAGGAERP